MQQEGLGPSVCFGTTLLDVCRAVEQMASQAGLLMMKVMIDEEVEQVAGQRHGYWADCQAWAHDERRVIFSGRDVVIGRRRVRSVGAHQCEGSQAASGVSPV